MFLLTLCSKLGLLLFKTGSFLVKKRASFTSNSGLALYKIGPLFVQNKLSRLFKTGPPFVKTGPRFIKDYNFDNLIWQEVR